MMEIGRYCDLKSKQAYWYNNSFTDDVLLRTVSRLSNVGNGSFAVLTVTAVHVQEISPNF